MDELRCAILSFIPDDFVTWAFTGSWYQKGGTTGTGECLHVDRPIGKNYFSSMVMVLPELWALNCGAYWHWMVAMPEVNSPGLVTHTS